MEYDYYGQCPRQRHVHEVVGSVDVAGLGENAHCHRFSTVSGQALSCGSDDHYHNVFFRTTFDNDHFHEFCGRTGGAIIVCNGHVHEIRSVTTMDAGHRHRFRVVSSLD